MPSFVCDYCQETLKKAKLDQHAQRCRQAVFSCIDCHTNFKGTEYRTHFSCITEVQKYHQKQPFVAKKLETKTESKPVNKTEVKMNLRLKLNLPRNLKINPLNQNFPLPSKSSSPALHHFPLKSSRNN